jgi:hypothetical protein
MKVRMEWHPWMNPATDTTIRTKVCKVLPEIYVGFTRKTIFRYLVLLCDRAFHAMNCTSYQLSNDTDHNRLFISKFTLLELPCKKAVEPHFVQTGLQWPLFPFLLIHCWEDIM